jgi:uncharacterized protein with HEPN domain
MSGRRDDSLLLAEVVGAAERLIELGERVSPGQLGLDRDITDMVQWNLLVLGEASKRLRQTTRDRFGDVPWSDLIRTRDRIIHHYEGMNWRLIAEIISAELPPLLPRLRDIRDTVRAEFDSGSAATRPHRRP